MDMTSPVDYLSGRTERRFSVLLPMGLLVLAACAPSVPPQPAVPVQIEGRSRDLRTLAGHWSGEFHNERTGRHGTIRFALQAGRDTGYARVVVDGPMPVERCVDPLSTAIQAPEPREFVLRLGRVAVSEGSVGGWLLPYPDPEAGCQVETWFEGTLMGDVLEGHYFSDLADGSPIRQGTWSVTRVR